MENKVMVHPDCQLDVTEKCLGHYVSISLGVSLRPLLESLNKDGRPNLKIGGTQGSGLKWNKEGKRRNPKSGDILSLSLSLSLLTGLQDRLKLQKLSQNKSSFL
jgi:hypothetical protein